LIDTYVKEQSQRQYLFNAIETSMCHLPNDRITTDQDSSLHSQEG
jgi:hypothetical protein